MADNNSVPDAISIDGHATSYNYYCNQDGKGAPFGSRKTATGSDSLANTLASFSRSRCAMERPLRSSVRTMSVSCQPPI